MISSQNSSSGAVFENWPLTFVHRRGGFGAFAKNVEFMTLFTKPCKIIAPAVENAPPRELSNYQCNLTAPAEKVGQLCAESPLFFCAGASARRQPRAEAFARRPLRGGVCAETPARRPRAKITGGDRARQVGFSPPAERLRGGLCAKTFARKPPRGDRGRRSRAEIEDHGRRSSEARGL